MSNLREPRIPGGSVGQQVSLGGAETADGKPAGTVVVSNGGYLPYSFVTGTDPDDSDLPASEVVLTSGLATNELYSVLLTVNAGDDIISGGNLTGRYPDVVTIQFGERLLLGNGSTIINRVDMVGIGAATNAAGFIMISNNTTESVTRGAMRTFEFDSSDEVKHIDVSLTPALGYNHTTEVPFTAILNISGRGYA